VACFAFEQDVAFMDTNIRRVVRRVFADPAAAPGEAELIALAEQAVPPSQGWAWNQAIMELGALICTASSPACWRCPLQAHCRDYQARLAADEQMPLLGEPAPAPRRRVAERREAPFVGSSRWYRGRIVDALRSLPPGGSLTLDQLGPQVKPDFAPDSDGPWLRRLAEGLARDGLASLDGEALRLPE
jgi:A/G-specific adenine glycosylase